MKGRPDVIHAGNFSFAQMMTIRGFIEWSWSQCFALFPSPSVVVDLFGD